MLHSKGWLQALPANVRHGCYLVVEANTLVYPTAINFLYHMADVLYNVCTIEIFTVVS
jgi:hypothetical protein